MNQIKKRDPELGTTTMLPSLGGVRGSVNDVQWGKRSQGIVIGGKNQVGGDTGTLKSGDPGMIWSTEEADSIH